MRINELPQAWSAIAPLFREHGEEGIATAYEKCADELIAALQGEQDQILTIAEAVEESGYSADHLRRLVRDGNIPNAGRPRAPRIARRDLPRRTAAVDRGAEIRHVDKEQIVRAAIDVGVE